MLFGLFDGCVAAWCQDNLKNSLITTVCNTRLCELVVEHTPRICLNLQIAWRTEFGEGSDHRIHIKSKLPCSLTPLRRRYKYSMPSLVPKGCKVLEAALTGTWELGCLRELVADILSIVECMKCVWMYVCIYMHLYMHVCMDVCKYTYIVIVYPCN